MLVKFVRSQRINRKEFVRCNRVNKEYYMQALFHLIEGIRLESPQFKKQPGSSCKTVRNFTLQHQ
jgi:hypothetical protein